MIILIGESGSGKSTIERQLTNFGFERAISHTTRPMRDGEKDGVDYHFISKDEFNKMFDAGEFLEHVEFNGNLYGLHKSNIKDEVVAVVEPKGMRQLSKLPDIHITSVYLKASEELRRKRMLARGDSVEAVEQRIVNDRECFAGLEDLATYTVEISEEDTVQEVTDKVIRRIYNDLSEDLRADIDTVYDILRPVRFFPNAVAALGFSFFLLAFAVLVAIGVNKIFPHNVPVVSYSLSQTYSNENGMDYPEELTVDEQTRKTDFTIWDSVEDKEIPAKGYKLTAGYYYLECENGATIFTNGKGHKGYDYAYFVVGNEAVKVIDVNSLEVESCGKIIYLDKPSILQTMGSCTIFTARDEVTLTSKVNTMLIEESIEEDNKLESEIDNTTEENKSESDEDNANTDENKSEQENN